MLVRAVQEASAANMIRALLVDLLQVPAAQATATLRHPLRLRRRQAQIQSHLQTVSNILVIALACLPSHHTAVPMRRPSFCTLQHGHPRWCGTGTGGGSNGHGLGVGYVEREGEETYRALGEVQEGTGEVAKLATDAA